MKTKLFISAIILAVGFSPFVSSAAVKYSRTPSGGSVTSPVTFNVYADKFSDFGLNLKITHFYLTMDADYTADGKCRPATNPFSFSEVLEAPKGGVAQGVAIYAFDESGCTHDVPNNFYYLEGDGSGVIFTVAGESVAAGVIENKGTETLVNQETSVVSGQEDLIRELKIQILKLQIRILELRLQSLLNNP